jgi:hypothetical protein
MKATIVALAAVLLLAACGHAKDPYTGRWVYPKGAIVVISKEGSDYLALAHLGHGPMLRIRFIRQGNRLVAVAPSYLFKPGAYLDPTTVLHFSFSGRYVALSKVSDSTTAP